MQRFSTEDGPGIRTTVFLKGCWLHCLWCQNPEGISPKPEVQWQEDRCIGCGTCITICQENCLHKTENRVIEIDRNKCTGCGDCVENCPANAMQLLGTQVEIGNLVNELGKDQIYFDKSGGGVTLSGGDPLMQCDFTVALLQSLQERGINSAIDTCGICSTACLDKVIPLADIILFDVKEIDSEKHHDFTGQYNQNILNNLIHINNIITNQVPEKILWIRTPLIPDSTATYDNISGIGYFISQNLAGTVQRWELCAFNNLCRDKYRRLGIIWPYVDTPLMTKDELYELEQCAKQSGVRPEIVVATGATRLES